VCVCVCVRVRVCVRTHTHTHTHTHTQCNKLILSRNIFLFKVIVFKPKNNKINFNEEYKSLSEEDLNIN